MSAPLKLASPMDEAVVIPKPTRAALKACAHDWLKLAAEDLEDLRTYAKLTGENLELSFSLLAQRLERKVEMVGRIVSEIEP